MTHAHPIGMEPSTQTAHRRLARNAAESVRGSECSERRFRPRECSTEGMYRIEIGCAFFVTFFAQAKKVNTE
jgi:hypothetical protein